MDTSKDYIEMCKAADEIQKLRKSWSMCIGGDFFHDNCWNEMTGESLAEALDIKYAIDRASDEENQKWLDSAVWLPRQDQLQAMRLGFHMNRSPIVLINVLAYFKACVQREWESSPIDFKMTFRTMEQIWLAIIMEENYNKKWNKVEKIWEPISDSDI